MKGERTRAACLKSADEEARHVWPVTAKVVDVTDADKFPNIAAAIRHVASLARKEL